MNSAQKPLPVTASITRHLPLIEKVLLAVLTAGIVFMVMKVNASLTKFALLGLGVTYFLSAYRPPLDIPEPQQNEPFGMKELLGLTIIPKVLWISSGVSAAAGALYLFNSANDAYTKLALIGGTAIAGGTLMLVFFSLTGVKHLRLVTPVLLRALPLFIADMYLLVSQNSLLS
jgi:hypothetical protein